MVRPGRNIVDPGRIALWTYTGLGDFTQKAVGDHITGSALDKGHPVACLFHFITECADIVRGNDRAYTAAGIGAHHGSMRTPVHQHDGLITVGGSKLQNMHHIVSLGNICNCAFKCFCY